MVDPGDFTEDDYDAADTRAGSPGDAPSADRDALDVSDPALRELALYRHTPDEIWSGHGQLLATRCAACNQAWPCATAEAVRDMPR